MNSDQTVDTTQTVVGAEASTDVTPSKKKSKYNTTDLDPEASFEKHVYHRDQFAHYLRWTHVLNHATIGETIADFGCGGGSLLEVFYRNKFKCKKYVGMDIRKKTIEAASEHFKNVPWAEFHAVDLIVDKYPYDKIQADKVISFEVAEHIGKQNIGTFLENFRACGNENATYYLSTPNFDAKVGAAGNHTFDSGDGRGHAVQEFAHGELQAELEKYFVIENKYGTFASQTHYKPKLNEWQQKMFDGLREYYDSNLVANIMAPFFPAEARNCLWVLKRK